jgi:hypothetical protein
MPLATGGQSGIRYGQAAGQASRSAAFCRSVIYSVADSLSRSVFEKEFPCFWTVTYD